MQSRARLRSVSPSDSAYPDGVRFGLPRLTEARMSETRPLDPEKLEQYAKGAFGVLGERVLRGAAVVGATSALAAGLGPRHRRE